MFSETSTRPPQGWDEPERSVIEEAMRILRQVPREDELIALPWMGLEYKSESCQG